MPYEETDTCEQLEAKLLATNNPQHAAQIRARMLELDCAGQGGSSGGGGTGPIKP